MWRPNNTVFTYTCGLNWAYGFMLCTIFNQYWWCTPPRIRSAEFTGLECTERKVESEKQKERLNVCEPKNIQIFEKKNENMLPTSENCIDAIFHKIRLPMAMHLKV